MKTIRIIHTNDIHSSYDELIKMAYIIKSLKNRLLSENILHILTFLSFCIILINNQLIR